MTAPKMGLTVMAQSTWMALGTCSSSVPSSRAENPQRQKNIISISRTIRGLLQASECLLNALTRSALLSDSLDFRNWHLADMPTVFGEVRFRGKADIRGPAQYDACRLARLALSRSRCNLSRSFPG